MSNSLELKTGVAIKWVPPCLLLSHLKLNWNSKFIHCFSFSMCTAIEAKELSSKIPLAEVITCSGFFLISFLEELIHHFIHPSDNHKKNKKSKIHRQRWLPSVKSKYKQGYMSCDSLLIQSSHRLILQYLHWRANLVKIFFNDKFSTNL